MSAEYGRKYSTQRAFREQGFLRFHEKSKKSWKLDKTGVNVYCNARKLSTIYATGNMEKHASASRAVRCQCHCRRHSPCHTTAGKAEMVISSRGIKHVIPVISVRKKSGILNEDNRAFKAVSKHGGGTIMTDSIAQ